MIKHNKTIKEKRTKRIRSRITVGNARPRLVVYRSNKHIFAQIIDRDSGNVIASASDMGVQSGARGSKTERAEFVGKQIAKIALSNKVSQVVFDRSFYKYHGRVKALAQAARDTGLEF